jgi:hypothetical protein
VAASRIAFEGVAVLLVLTGEGGGGVEDRLGLHLAALGRGLISGDSGVLDAGGEGGDVAVARRRLAPGTGHHPADGQRGRADDDRRASEAEPGQELPAGRTGLEDQPPVVLGERVHGCPVLLVAVGDHPAQLPFTDFHATTSWCSCS